VPSAELPLVVVSLVPLAELPLAVLPLVVVSLVPLAELPLVAVSLAPLAELPRVAVSLFPLTWPGFSDEHVPFPPRQHLFGIPFYGTRLRHRPLPEASVHLVVCSTLLGMPFVVLVFQQWFRLFGVGPPYPPSVPGVRLVLE